MLYSFVASLALHLLVLACAVVMVGISGFFPPEPLQGSPANEVVVYLPDLIPEEAPPISKQEEMPYIRTGAHGVSERPPGKADFYSDKDTIAASEKPGSAEGDPLPTQEGLQDMPFLELQDRRYSDGERENENASAAPSAMVPPSFPAPRPEPAPEPVKVAEAIIAPSSSQTREESFSDALDIIENMPISQDRDTPPQDVPEEKARNLDESRMAESLPPLQETVSEITPREPVPLQAPSPPGSDGQEGFRPETRRTKMTGTISSLGDAAVNAAATPLGRYKKQIGQSIERLWHRYRQDRADFLEFGSMKLRFDVDRYGKPRNLKILKNDANAVMMDFTLSAILEADIPPMPEEIIDILENESLEVTYDVIIY